MDVGSTSLPAYKTPNKLEGKFKSDELFMLVVAHISLFTSFRSQTKSGGTLAILKKNNFKLTLAHSLRALFQSILQYGWMKISSLRALTVFVMGPVNRFP
jgi:hypothetical protein